VLAEPEGNEFCVLSEEVAHRLGPNDDLSGSTSWRTSKASAEPRWRGSGARRSAWQASANGRKLSGHGTLDLAGGGPNVERPRTAIPAAGSAEGDQ
jgi:hypothetical protein